MSLALDPNARVEFTLAGYEEWPPEKQPTFIARHLTARELLRYDQIIERAVGRPPSEREAEFGDVVEALTIGLVGWRNVPGKDGLPLEFDIAQLPDVLSYRDLWELVRLTNLKPQLSESDSKKSGLASSQFPAAGSATVAQDVNTVVRPVPRTP